MAVTQSQRVEVLSRCLLFFFLLSFGRARGWQLAHRSVRECWKRSERAERVRRRQRGEETKRIGQNKSRFSESRRTREVVSASLTGSPRQGQNTAAADCHSHSCSVGFLVAVRTDRCCRIATGEEATKRWVKEREEEDRDSPAAPPPAWEAETRSGTRALREKSRSQ